MAYTELTAAQGAILRNRIGDTDTTDPKLSDTVLDACYVEADRSLDKATVEALQQLAGIYAMHVDIGGSTQLNEQRRQRFLNITEKLIPYWENRTGLAGGTLTAGKLRRNIDTKLADLDME